jgi:putative transcriptional regulator
MRAASRREPDRQRDGIYQKSVELKMSASKIIQGLDEAIAFAAGDVSRSRVKTIKVPEHIDVKALRATLDLSQAEFAERFNFQLAAIQNWEQGRRFPTPSAVTLLKVIEMAPEAVERAVRYVKSNYSDECIKEA